MHSPKQRWVSVATNLALGAIGLVVGLFAAEGLVRLVQPEALTVVDPGLYELDPPRRYRLHPGYRGRLSNLADFTTEVTISAQGQRDETASAKPEGEARLLVLGDSYAFGWGVEQPQAFRPGSMPT